MLGTSDQQVSPTENRYCADDDGVFVDVNGTPAGWTVIDTRGCSAKQIIDAAHLRKGHLRFGITNSALEAWVASMA